MHDDRKPSPLAAACVALAARKGWKLPDLAEPIRPASEAISNTRMSDTQRTALLFRQLWRLSGDEMFGLGLHPVPRGAFQVLCLAVSSAPDLGAAMLRFAEAATVFPGLPRFSVDIGAEEIRWAADVREVDDAEHLVADSAVLFAHRLFGWATGMALPIRRVELCYPKPDHATVHERNFLGPLVFDSAEAALIIDGSLRGTPIVQTADTLVALLGTAPSGFLDRTDHDIPLGDRVRRLLDMNRYGPWMTVDEIARRLNMSAPTLRRKLRAEHTTVSALRDGVLRDAAFAALAREQQAIAEVAVRLGYSEPGAFTRAFRRWTGETPQGYRTTLGRQDGTTVA